jgi:hypothetical protein
MLKEAGSAGHFQENCRNSPAAHPQPFIEAHPRPMFMMITIFIHLLLPTTTTTTDDEEYHRHIINCKHYY